MKFTSTLVILALLGTVSTHKAKSLKRVETPDGVIFLLRESDELANGDKLDDIEIEDGEIDDDNDDFVSDTGF